MNPRATFAALGAFAFLSLGPGGCSQAPPEGGELPPPAVTVSLPLERDPQSNRNTELDDSTQEATPRVPAQVSQSSLG